MGNARRGGSSELTVASSGVQTRVSGFGRVGDVDEEQVPHERSSYADKDVTGNGWLKQGPHEEAHRHCELHQIAREMRS